MKGDDNLIADALTRMLSLPDSNDVQFAGDWSRTSNNPTYWASVTSQKKETNRQVDKDVQAVLPF